MAVLKCLLAHLHKIMGNSTKQGQNTCFKTLFKYKCFSKLTITLINNNPYHSKKQQFSVLYDSECKLAKK